MLYMVISDGTIKESYGMPNHNDTHHLTNAGNRQAVKSITVSQDALDTEYTYICDATTAAVIMTLPLAGLVTGRIYNFKKIDASVNTVTVLATGAEIIDGTSDLIISSRYDSYTVQSDGTQWWIL